MSPDVLFNEICEKHLEDVFHFCVYLVHNNPILQDVAEECTQETFLEAKRQLDKLITHPNIKGWLFQTAKNKVNRAFRDHYSRKRYEVMINEIIVNTATDFVGCPFENELYKNVDYDQLKDEVLKQLKAHEYKLYLEYFLQNKSIDELSSRYQISRTAVTTRIYRVKKHIKKIAEEVEFIDTF